MRNEQYGVEISSTSMIFEFVSEGPKGAIRKRVSYRHLRLLRKYWMDGL